MIKLAIMYSNSAAKAVPIAFLQHKKHVFANQKNFNLPVDLGLIKSPITQSWLIMLITHKLITRKYSQA